MSRDAAYWISKLKLERHVEGGSFRETYRSVINIHPDGFIHDGDSKLAADSGKRANGDRASVSDQASVSVPSSLSDQSSLSNQSSLSDQSSLSVPSSLSDQQSRSSNRFNGPRSASTAIYFLLEQGQFSAFHTIKSDEVWHFYDGDPLDIYEISDHGELITHKLGRDPEKGESLQAVVKAGNWFGSRVAAGGKFSLVGCTVAPGFDFADFQLAERAMLTHIYPTHAQLISELTYS